MQMDKDKNYCCSFKEKPWHRGTVGLHLPVASQKRVRVLVPSGNT